MKNIIFDWSGVIKDCVLSQLWVVNKIFEQYGVNPISLSEFQENWQQPYMLFYEKYLPKVGIEEEQRAYREAMSSPDCPKANSFPGIVDLIIELKSKGYFMTVVSSDFPETLMAEVKEYGLENVFNEIATDVHDKFEAVEALITKNNLKRDDTFFIGDSNHEIEVSKKAGIKSIAVTWGFCNEDKLKSSDPDYLFSELGQLKNLITKL
jgi:phosphoglycolate phosphatase